MIKCQSKYALAFLVLLTLSLKKNIMQELIDKLKTEAGLTEEQAKQAISTIKNYVVEKFPMLEGAVSNVFGGE